MENRYPAPPRRTGSSRWNASSDLKWPRLAGDRALLHEVRNGDEQALFELMKRHKEAVFRFAFRYHQDEGKAAGVVEKTFVRLFFRSGNCQPSLSVSAWLLSIAADICRGSGRKT